MTQNKVAIAMVTYNHEPFIAQAVNAVLEQRADFEYKLFIADDCSSDNTSEICTQLALENPEAISLRVNRQNLGVNKNFFLLLEEILKTTPSFEYIALCDGDDYWTDPLKLQKQIDCLETNKSYVLSFHDAKLIDTENKVLFDSYLKTINGRCDRSRFDLINAWHFKTSTAIFRNGCINIRDLGNYVNQDTILFSLLGKFGKGKFQPEIGMTTCRIHRGGIWSSKNKQERLSAQLKSFKFLSQYHNYTYGLTKRTLNLAQGLSKLALRNRAYGVFVSALPILLSFKFRITFLVFKTDFNTLNAHVKDFYRYRIRPLISGK